MNKVFKILGHFPYIEMIHAINLKSDDWMIASKNYRIATFAYCVVFDFKPFHP